MPAKITNPNSDIELILEIKKSSESAFKNLFIKYYKTLIDFCLYRTADLDVSKDLVQDLFTKLWISRDRLDPEKSIMAYLYKSLINQIINYTKHSSTKTISFNESISQKETTNITDLESRIDIYTAIEKLPEKLKTTFMLSRIEGFKYSEIAELCEISIKAVEKRMTKALNILRNSMK